MAAIFIVARDREKNKVGHVITVFSGFYIWGFQRLRDWGRRRGRVSRWRGRWKGGGGGVPDVTEEGVGFQISPLCSKKKTGSKTKIRIIFKEFKE